MDTEVRISASIIRRRTRLEQSIPHDASPPRRDGVLCYLRSILRCFDRASDFGSRLFVRCSRVTAANNLARNPLYSEQAQQEERKKQNNHQARQYVADTLIDFRSGVFKETLIEFGIIKFHEFTCIFGER